MGQQGGDDDDDDDGHVVVWCNSFDVVVPWFLDFVLRNMHGAYHVELNMRLSYCQCCDATWQDQRHYRYDGSTWGLNDIGI